MKKILSIISLISLGATAMAQDIKVAPEVGATYNTLWQTINGNKYETQYQVGLRVGGVVDYKVNEHFSLQSGLHASINNGTESHFVKYYKTSSGVPSSDDDLRDYHVTYLQLPVYAMLKSGKEFDDPHFFVGIGPSFNLAIGGRFKQEFSSTLNGVPIPTSKDNTIEIGNSRTQDKIRPFDLSANVTAGIELPMGLYFRAYYGIGLLNVAPSGNSDNKFRNSGAGISVGFFFKTSNRPNWQ